MSHPSPHSNGRLCHFFLSFSCYASFAGPSCNSIFSHTLLVDFVFTYPIDPVALHFPYAPFAIKSYRIPRIPSFYSFRPLCNPSGTPGVYHPTSKYHPCDTQCPVNQILREHITGPVLPVLIIYHLVQDLLCEQPKFATGDQKKDKQALADESSMDGKV